MRRSRMLNMATVQENHDRFLRRAVEFQSVWTVWGNSGPLVVEADGNEVAPRDVYLFFSDEAEISSVWSWSPATCGPSCTSVFRRT